MNIFAQHAPIYSARGLWPRPIKPGSKACFEKGWQTFDGDLAADAMPRWLRQRGDFGIGLLMGSPIPDGTRLGALDVDRNEYTQLARALLRNPVCGRVGEKGAVFFVRVRGDLGNPEFRVAGTEGKKWGKVAECLFVKKLCVIPPTVHPSTKKPYRWIGTPLNEVDLLALPLIGE